MVAIDILRRVLGSVNGDHVVQNLMFTAKKKSSPIGLLFFLVAETGFELRRSRVATSGFGLFALAHEGNIPPTAEWIPTHAIRSILTIDILRRVLGSVNGNLVTQNSMSVAKKKSSPIGLLFFLVAETGFEPRDLRVMSPTSYQAALLRDMGTTRGKLVPETGVEPARYFRITGF